MTVLAERPPLPSAALQARVHRRYGWTIGIVAMTLATLALTTWAIAQASQSDYYAAIALSMSKSWSNFFFGAFDPSGTVSSTRSPDRSGSPPCS